MMHTLRGPNPARRIAVMEVPRGRNNRLGRVGSIRNYDWSTIPAIASLTDEPYLPAAPYTATGAVNNTPPTSATWMASILQRQSDQRESTPGTLTYTPVIAPQPNTVARWNSWAGPCPPSGGAIANTATPGGAPSSNGAAGGGLNVPALLYVAAALGAAASAAYLLNTLMDGRK
jgi:hypothetical protein